MNDLWARIMSALHRSDTSRQATRGDTCSGSYNHDDTRLRQIGLWGSKGMFENR